MKTRLGTYAIASCVGLLYSTFALAQSNAPAVPPDWPGRWHMWGGGWEFMWMFPLFMFLIIGFCIALFLFFYRMWGSHHRVGPMWHMMDRSWGDPTFSALQLLNERYARGEIQKAEYEEKKAAILSHR